MSAFKPNTEYRCPWKCGVSFSYLQAMRYEVQGQQRIQCSNCGRQVHYEKGTWQQNIGENRFDDKPGIIETAKEIIHDIAIETSKPDIKSEPEVIPKRSIIDKVRKIRKIGKISPEKDTNQ